MEIIWKWTIHCSWAALMLKHSPLSWDYCETSETIQGSWRPYRRHLFSLSLSRDCWLHNSHTEYALGNRKPKGFPEGQITLGTLTHLWLTISKNLFKIIRNILNLQKLSETKTTQDNTNRKNVDGSNILYIRILSIFRPGIQGFFRTGTKYPEKKDPAQRLVL